MTFPQVKTLLKKNYPQLYVQQNNTAETQKAELYRLLKGKALWHWDPIKHRQIAKEFRAKEGEGLTCGCQTHELGNPIDKHGKKQPLFDYEQMIFDLLEGTNKGQKVKYLWIKKATGLGITEFFLRYIIWKCTYDNSMQGNRICIVVGPNISLATTLITRLRGILARRFDTITFDSKATVLELNGCIIEVFPAHHIDAVRGLTEVRYILVDEADFIPQGQQDNIRHVVERYRTKSDSIIILVSTPNLPGGLFERIELEPDDTCIYHKLRLDYKYGIHKVYSESDIGEAFRSPGFMREFALQYGAYNGNNFSHYSIDVAVEKGRATYDPVNLVANNPWSQKVIGVDPAFGGSSSFGIVVASLEDLGPPHFDTIKILYAEQFSRPQFNDMIDHVLELITRFGMNNDDCKILVDGANPAFISTLRVKMGLNPDVAQLVDRAKKAGFNNPISLSNILGKVEPVNFGTGNSAVMQNHLRMLLDEGHLAIHPSLTKLITALKGAYEENGNLLKESPYNDLTDSMKLAASWFRIAPA